MNGLAFVKFFFVLTSDEKKNGILLINQLSMTGITFYRWITLICVILNSVSSVTNVESSKKIV